MNDGWEVSNDFRYESIELWRTVAIEMSRQRKQDGDLYSSEEVIRYATSIADAYKDYAEKLGKEDN